MARKSLGAFLIGLVMAAAPVLAPPVISAPGDFDVAIQQALQMDLNQTLAKAGLRRSMVTGVNLTLSKAADQRPGIRAVSVTLQTDERGAAEAVIAQRLRRDGFHIAGLDQGQGGGPVASIATVAWPTVAIPWVTLAIMAALSSAVIVLLALLTRWRVAFAKPKRIQTASDQPADMAADTPIAGMKRAQWLKAPLDLVIQRLVPMAPEEREQLLDRLQLPSGVRQSLDRQLARELERLAQEGQGAPAGPKAEDTSNVYGRHLDPIQPPTA